MPKIEEKTGDPILSIVGAILLLEALIPLLSISKIAEDWSSSAGVYIAIQLIIMVLIALLGIKVMRQSRICIYIAVAYFVISTLFNLFLLFAGRFLNLVMFLEIAGLILLLFWFFRPQEKGKKK